MAYQGVAIRGAGFFDPIVVDLAGLEIGGPAPIARAVKKLFEEPSRRAQERRDLDEIATKFEGRRAAQSAAQIIEKMLADR